MYTNERVILIKGDRTKWYDQVIFIAKRNVPPQKVPVDFVREAENIISGYMEKAGLKNHSPASLKNEDLVKVQAINKPKKSKFDFILNTVMLASCIALAGVMLWTMR